MPVRLDYTNALKMQVGEDGITQTEIKACLRRAAKARTKLKSRYSGGKLGFVELPADKATSDRVVKFARSMRGKIDDVIVLGIGGSALGARAVHNAINGEYYNVFERSRRGLPRLFILDNVDPEPIAQVLRHVDPERAMVNVITKSGSTAETMAALLVFEEAFRNRLGKAARKRIVVTTDPEKGDLRAIAEQEGFSSFEIPANVGGRFSVLTPVGLLPLAMVGIDIKALLGGAGGFLARFWPEQIEKNPAAVAAVIEYLLDTRRGKNIQVIFPYANALSGLAAWYCQLWAESLGKAHDRKGKPVNVGQTPVFAQGATDQHSQLQLYMEGPADKTFSFWTVDEFRDTVRLPSNWSELGSTGYLGRKSFNRLIAAEQRAVERALAEVGRPSLTFRIPRIDEIHIGELIALFELQAAIAGELYDVDAYDQPGVEPGKIATYALMGRKGYEDLAAEIEANEKDIKRAIV